jgi:hypothetical protein
MRTLTFSLLMSAIFIPVYAGAETVQQTTVTTSTVSQGNAMMGGSVFNPFPLLGAGAPLATSPTTFNPSPIVGNAPRTPPTGTSVFNPFPLAGAAAPLAVPVQPFTSPTTGTAAPRFPDAAVGTLRPGALNGSTFITTNTPITAPGTTTTTTISTADVLSGTSNAFQSTVTTTAPLFLTGTSSSLTGIVGSTTTSVLVQNPEPSGILLFASGCAALAWYFRKRWWKAGFDRQAEGPKF